MNSGQLAQGDSVRTLGHRPGTLARKLRRPRTVVSAMHMKEEEKCCQKITLIR
jgi:hypothetical protein